MKVMASYRDQEIEIEADMAQASAPIFVDGSATGLQVADARHRTSIAVAIGLTSAGLCELPSCPAGMTPDEWKILVDEEFSEIWSDVAYRECE